MYQKLRRKIQREPEMPALANDNSATSQKSSRKHQVKQHCDGHCIKLDGENNGATTPDRGSFDA